MDNFWNWFIGESGAGWIVGLLTVALAVYTWFKQSRPPIVIIQEIERIRLLDIHPSHQKKINIYYSSTSQNSKEIQDLIQNKFVIYNSGTADISEKISLKLLIDARGEKPSFVDIIIDNTATTKISSKKNGESVIDINLPYLNSFPNHKRQITGHIVSDKNIGIRQLEGFGKGWSTYFVPLSKSIKVSAQAKKFISRITNLLFAISIISMIIYGVLVFRSPYGAVYLNPTPENISAAIERYSANLEKLTNNQNFWEKLGSTNEDFSWLKKISYIALFAYMLLPVFAEQIGNTFTRFRLGIEPRSRFVNDEDQ